MNRKPRPATVIDACAADQRFAVVVRIDGRRTIVRKWLTRDEAAAFKAGFNDVGSTISKRAKVVPMQGGVA